MQYASPWQDDAAYAVSHRCPLLHDVMPICVKTLNWTKDRTSRVCTRCPLLRTMPSRLTASTRTTMRVFSAPPDACLYRSPGRHQTSSQPSVVRPDALVRNPRSRGSQTRRTSLDVSSMPASRDALGPENIEVPDFFAAWPNLMCVRGGVRIPACKISDSVPVALASIPAAQPPSRRGCCRRGQHQAALRSSSVAWTWT